MSLNYSRKLLQISLAQICQNLGWNCIHSTPLEILTDVLERYMLEVAKVTHRYSEQFGRTVPNLNDVGLAFQQFGVQLDEFEDYIRHMDPVPFANSVVAFPVPKQPNLQFPNPESKEIAQREEHVDPHLPPMFPGMEEEIETVLSSPPNSGTQTAQQESPSGNVLSSPTAGDKRPSSSPGEGPAFKRPKLISSLPDEAGHSQYEMMNVSMSHTGFLTPTRGQGKLPDARTPPTNIVVVEPKVPKSSETVTKKVKEVSAVSDSKTKDKSSPASKEKVSSEGENNVTNNAVAGEKIKKTHKLSTKPFLKIKEMKKKISKLPRSPLVTKPMAKPISKPKQKSPGRPPKKTKSLNKESKLKELLLSTANKEMETKSGQQSKSKSKSSSKAVPDTEAKKSETEPITTEPHTQPTVKSERVDSFDSLDDDSSGSRLVIAENEVKSKMSKEAKKARSAAMNDSIDSVIKQSSQETKSQQKETTYLVKEDGSMIKIGEKIKASALNKSSKEKEKEDIEDSEPLEQEQLDASKKGDNKDPVVYSSVESITASIDSAEEVTDEDTFPYEGTPDRNSPSSQVEDNDKNVKSKETKSKDGDKVVRDKLKEKLKKKSLSQDSEESSSKRKFVFEEGETSETEKVTKAPISVYDFPESPPTKPFHLLSSSRTSSESLDVPSRIPEASVDKPKEKVKEKSKDKQHKKDKKDRKREKEKKKKNKNKDKHRGDRSKEEYDESSISLLVSARSRGSPPPKAEPSPSSTPTRPEIPKLVIKPMQANPTSPERKPVVLSPPHSAPVIKSSPVTPGRRGRPPKRRGQRGRKPGSPAVSRCLSAPYDFEKVAAIKEEVHSDHDDGTDRFPLPSLVSADWESKKATPPKLLPSSFNMVFDTKPKTETVISSPIQEKEVSKLVAYHVSTMLPTPLIQQSPTTTPTKDSSVIPPIPPPSMASGSSVIPPMPPPSKAGLSKQRTVITETVATYEDASGERIWICPGCKLPDDGSAMIGCDSCDEWYHWPCVNIVAEPGEDENWYCPKCNPTRKQPKKKNIVPKKRGRKKKT
ncbi:hypothetical protein ScPMuIL_009766 [Solemya velum]